MDRRGQRWILNVLVGRLGIDALHPGGRATLEQFGYASTDIEQVFSRVKGGEMTVKAWVTRGAEVERMARRAEDEGFLFSAHNLYLRAAQLYGRGQYSIFRDDPVKSAYHAKLVECYHKMIELSPVPIERIEIPFQDKIVYALLHLPATRSGKVPAVLLVPGMDMMKEDWTKIAQETIVSQGMAALAIDGPGQGESLLRGLKVTVDNYDRAARAAMDYLVTRPEVDGDRIALWGTSMGSHWGTRIAAAEPRLKAAATIMGVYGSKETIFNFAQPSFRLNYMYMSGIYEEAEFDKMAAQMTLDSVVPNVKCPFLMVHGEFDELSPVEDALAIYELVTAPKEIWIYENQFHGLGGVAMEIYSLIADWLLCRLKGIPLKSNDRRLYLREDGSVTEGDARPLWWTPERLLEER